MSILSEFGLLKLEIRRTLDSFDPTRLEFNEKLLKIVKSTVKNGRNEHIDCLTDCIFQELSKKGDCDRRLANVWLADVFFNRSHMFRLQLVDRLQYFLLYTLETDPLRWPLPQQNRQSADRLKKETLKIVKNWSRKFGPAYPKLSVSLWLFVNIICHVNVRDCEKF